MLFAEQILKETGEYPGSFFYWTPLERVCRRGVNKLAATFVARHQKVNMPVQPLSPFKCRQKRSKAT